MPEHEQVDPDASFATRPATTGDRRVDAAVEPLASLDHLPVHEHPAVVEDVHQQLRDILAQEQE